MSSVPERLMVSTIDWTLRVFEIGDMDAVPILGVALAKAGLSVHAFEMDGRGFVAADTSGAEQERAMFAAIAQWTPGAVLTHLTRHDGCPAIGLPTAG